MLLLSKMTVWFSVSGVWGHPQKAKSDCDSNPISGKLCAHTCYACDLVKKKKQWVKSGIENNRKISNKNAPDKISSANFTVIHFSIGTIYHLWNRMKMDKSIFFSLILSRLTIKNQKPSKKSRYVFLPLLFGWFLK